jgi:tetratricopeptide (TPR) repeat protein
VHHAEGAGDLDALRRFALPAARQAAGSSSHRAALAHYRRALRFADSFSDAELRIVYEEASHEAYMSTEFMPAVAYAQEALARYGSAGDAVGVSRCHRWLSRLHWYSGRRSDAEESGRLAVEVLDGVPASTELAWAYSNMSQLAMLEWDRGAAERWGAKALELAARLGDVEVQAHALVNVGTVRVEKDPDDDRLLLEAFEIARAVGDHHEATRAIQNLALELTDCLRMARAQELTQRALNYADEHDIRALWIYLRAMQGRLDLMTGRWVEADEVLEGVVGSRSAAPTLLALATRAQLWVRLGRNTDQVLRKAWPIASSLGEVRRSLPLVCAEAERDWLAGRPISNVTQLWETFEKVRGTHRYLAGSVGRWLQEAGEDVSGISGIDGPMRLELQGQWSEAARAWGALGLPYDQAFALAHTEDGRAEALRIAHELGAVPLARRLHGAGRRTGVGQG